MHRVLFGIASLWINLIASIIISCFLNLKFNVSFINYSLYIFLILTLGEALILLVIYFKGMDSKDVNSLLNKKSDDNDISSSLEKSHFQSEEEINNNFKVINYSELSKEDYHYSFSGCELNDDNDLKLILTPPSHSLIIGSTGSGKTSTYIIPLIESIKSSKNKPSMVISDPKGELFINLHDDLVSKGYEVKTIDLRSPYNSLRWNPLEKSYLKYQEVTALKESLSELSEEEASSVNKQINLLNDEIYDDLNDIISTLCPITSSEPIWENGAKNFILALALAMLEDSAYAENEMEENKFNFYSLLHLASETDEEYQPLKRYFSTRDKLSLARTLSKQVLESSDKTLGSYLSTVFNCLNIFNDTSISYLTSKNEIDFSSMEKTPTAVFLIIPDEKTTRYKLASMIINQSYKELLARANKNKSLSLSRPVYYILDEFGNLPYIQKIESMITVGRSRNIYFNLVVQSYNQLYKTYGDKAGNIIKTNCNEHVYIGSNDLATLNEISKQCGNYSFVRRSVSSRDNDDNLATSSSLSERPLIYPRELAELNNDKNKGNAVILLQGYAPLKVKFTPYYDVDFFCKKKTSFKDRLNKEDFVLKSYSIFNYLRFIDPTTNKFTGFKISFYQETTFILAMVKIIDNELASLLSEDERKKLKSFYNSKDYETTLNYISIKIAEAEKNNNEALKEILNKLKTQTEDFKTKFDAFKEGIKNQYNK